MIITIKQKQKQKRVTKFNTTKYWRYGWFGVAYVYSEDSQYMTLLDEIGMECHAERNKQDQHNDVNMFNSDNNPTELEDLLKQADVSETEQHFGKQICPLYITVWYKTIRMWHVLT